MLVDSWDSSTALGIVWPTAEGSVVGEGVVAAAGAVGVKAIGASMGPLGAWSRGDPAAERSATGSSTADSFWGPLGTGEDGEVKGCRRREEEKHHYKAKLFKPL